MPKLLSIRAREVVRVALSIGFVLDRQKGSHAVYYRAADSRRVVIPVHGTKEPQARHTPGHHQRLGPDGGRVQREITVKPHVADGTSCLRRYMMRAGLGTIIALMLPSFWTALLQPWIWLDIALGPAGPQHYPRAVRRRFDRARPPL